MSVRPTPLVRAVRRARLARVRLSNIGARLQVGSHFVIGRGAVISRQAHLVAGDRVAIGAYLTQLAHIRVADDVMISAHVGFIGDDHPFDGTTEPITAAPPRPLATITLEGDNLIGYGATIIGDVTIGRGAIVAAGALVTRDVEPDAVVAGRPARVIRRRRREPHA